MTLADDLRHVPPPAFGAGGAEPYARALASGGAPRFVLQEAAPASDAVDASAETADAARPAVLDMGRWTAEADAADLRLLAAVRGPLLDIGCGPGRMVRAALGLGLDAWGVDVSDTAVDRARAEGLRVVRGSVFDAMPLEGAWQTVLLVDGNVGIGGDVAALLARCAELLAPRGEVVVETHRERRRDHAFVARLVDPEGRASEDFPWAEAGLDVVRERGEASGLRMRQAWSAEGRTFCRLAKIRP